MRRPGAARCDTHSAAGVPELPVGAGRVGQPNENAPDQSPCMAASLLAGVGADLAHPVGVCWASMAWNRPASGSGTWSGLNQRPAGVLAGRLDASGILNGQG